MNKVELLYFDGCPSWQGGLKNFEEALSLEGVKADIDLILIESHDAANKERFLGSPSFRMGGIDLWPEDRESYTMGCRIYATKEGFKGIPTVAMLREKIREMQENNPRSIEA